MHLGRRVARTLKREGWLGTVRLLGLNMLRLPGLLLARRMAPDTLFDEKYQVETALTVHISELEVNSQNFAFGTPYGPVTTGRFQAVMDCLEIDHSRFTFVDLGSGKGRALLLAAALPFREIIGVEFARELHEVAQQNIRTFTGPVRCRNIHSIWADATQFEFPGVPLVIFMFHPFVGKTMMEVLRNIESSLRACPREAYVLYVNPKLGDVFGSSSCFRVSVRDTLHCVYQSVVTAPATAVESYPRENETDLPVDFQGSRH